MINGDVTHGFNAEIWLVADHVVYEVDAGRWQGRQQRIAARQTQSSKNLEYKSYAVAAWD